MDLLGPEPKDIPNLYYFTKRDIQPNGKAIVWVFYPFCPHDNQKLIRPKRKTYQTFKCKNCDKDFLIRKDKKTFSCPSCKFEEKLSSLAKTLWCEKCQRYYDSDELKLTANISYTCPKCQNTQNKLQLPWIRKAKKISGKSIKAFTFNCSKCNEPIDIYNLKDLSKVDSGEE